MKSPTKLGRPVMEAELVYAQIALIENPVERISRSLEASALTLCGEKAVRGRLCGEGCAGKPLR